MVRLSQTQNFPELNADLQQHIEQIQALISEVSHVERAPPTGWRVDVFPRANGITRGGSAPPWSQRPPSVEPEVWLVTGKPVQRQLRDIWKRDDTDGFAQQEARRAAWLEAKNSGYVTRSFVVRGTTAQTVAACDYLNIAEVDVDYTTEASRSGNTRGIICDSKSSRGEGSNTQPNEVIHPVTTADGGVRAATPCLAQSFSHPMTVSALKVDMLRRDVRARLLSGDYTMMCIELCHGHDLGISSTVPSQVLAVRIASSMLFD